MDGDRSVAAQSLTERARLDSATASELRNMGENTVAAAYEDRSAHFRLSYEALMGSERAYLTLSRTMRR